MNQVQSPLKPESIWLERIIIKESAHHIKSVDEDYNMTLKANVKRRKDRLSYKVKLVMVFAPAQSSVCNYEKVETHSIGIFDFAQDTDPEFIKLVVPVNCLAIIHGFTRAIVAQITALSPAGTFMLPSVNFVEFVKEETKKHSKSSK